MRAVAPPVTLTPPLGVVLASSLEQRPSASENFLRRIKPDAWLRRAPQIISTEASSAPNNAEAHVNVRRGFAKIAQPLGCRRVDWFSHQRQQQQIPCSADAKCGV